MKQERGGIDKEIFAGWVKLFVEDVRDLTANGRKVLLLYDAYRSHMSLTALIILEQNGVIAFAIPAHTSGSTQPLDVGVFQPWKSNISVTIQSMFSASSHNKFDLFDLCKIMTSAYYSSFNADNIKKGFSKTGIYHFNPLKLLNIPQPRSEEAPHVTVTPAEMEVMLEERREERREGAGVTPLTFKRGFLNTKAGHNLTSAEAISEVKKKKERETKKAEEKYKKMVLNELKYEEEVSRRKEERLRFERARAFKHVMLYDEPFDLPRPMKRRRRYAAERAVLNKAARLGMESLTFDEKCRYPGFNPSVDQWEDEMEN